MLLLPLQFIRGWIFNIYCHFAKLAKYGSFLDWSPCRLPFTVKKMAPSPSGWSWSVKLAKNDYWPNVTRSHGIHVCVIGRHSTSGSECFLPLGSASTRNNHVLDLPSLYTQKTFPCQRNIPSCSQAPWQKKCYLHITYILRATFRALNPLQASTRAE